MTKRCIEFTRVKVAMFCCYTLEPHVMDNAGETALHWACKSEEDNNKVVDLLLGR